LEHSRRGSIWPYLLGYVGPVARRELHLIRRIRNEFAHEYKPLQFTEPSIESRCRELRAYSLFPDPLPRANFIRTAMGLLAVIHSRLSRATHALPSKDTEIVVPQEEQERVKELVWNLVQDLASGTSAPSPSQDIPGGGSTESQGTE